MLIGKDIFIWLILSLICGCIPLFLGVRLVNQFGKMTKLDYQEHNLIYNSIDNSINKKALNYLENQNFSSQIKTQKQKNFSEQFFGKNKTQEVEIYLHRVFYELLESKNGYLTTLNFAIEAKFSGKIAGEFLTQKAKEFNHQIIVDNDGGLAWKFEYLTQSEIKNLSKD